MKKDLFLDSQIGIIRALAENPGPETIASLLQALRTNESWEVRRAAAEALGQIGGQEIVPALLAAAQEEMDIDVLASIFSAIAAHTGIATLTRVLQSPPNDTIRAAVVIALGRTDAPEAVPILMDCLKSHLATVRLEAARALGRRMVGQAIAPLSEVLTKKEEDSKVRRVAAEAIAQIGGDDAVRILKEAASSPDAAIRAAAVGALGWIRPPGKALGILRRAISDEHEMVRKAAADALGATMHPRAVKILTRALAREKRPSVRTSIVQALGHFDTPDAIGALTLSLEKDPSWVVREKAAEMLERHSSRTDVLVTLSAAVFQDSRDEVREAAARALGKNPLAIPVMIRAMSTLDDGYLLLQTIAMVLAETGDPQAIGALVQLAAEEQDTLRHYAALWGLVHAMAKIGLERWLGLVMEHPKAAQILRAIARRYAGEIWTTNWEVSAETICKVAEISPEALKAIAAVAAKWDPKWALLVDP